MIEPILGLSFSLHAQKGAYSLLLGSGISRSADIPTGWEVTLDLVRKVAHMLGEECAGREAEWYLEKYGREPDYSSLLAAVGATSAAQQQILRGYFEASEEEREQGSKAPTSAHKAIAQLVASGHIRVIVTTNFDRLMEAALEAINIAPIVVASSDATEGMPPLAHTRCTIIKVHGDYLDHRIRNAPEALAKYDKRLNTLLDQVWDEYGLIVCGWSADYDIALRASLERCKSRRYPTYWVARSSLKGAAKGLVTLRSAQVIEAPGADEFFSDLSEKISALDEFSRPHPLSIEAAVATLKRYMSEERYHIQLHEFLLDEANTARQVITKLFEQPLNQQLESAFPPAVSALESASERLVTIFSVASFYSNSKQSKSIADAFQLVANLPPQHGGFVLMQQLIKYPTLLLAYSVGIAATLSGNYEVLREIAYRPAIIRDSDENKFTAPDRFYPHAIADRSSWNALMLPGQTGRLTPVSDHIWARIRPIFIRYCPDHDQFTRAFDEFEFLWSLLHVEAQQLRGIDNIWTPPGAFSWRWARRSAQTLEAAEAAANGDLDAWPPIKGGLFGRSPQRLKAATEHALPTIRKWVASA